jgi:lysophospholipase L1-like esterase
MRQRRLAALSLSLTLLVAGLLTGPASPAQAAAVDYVALGDSYSAGVGAPGLSGLCLRSPQGYPKLWADAHAVSSFDNATCSGAVTADVRHFQIWALNSGTDAVTITIGGNDVGFFSTIVTCTFGSTAACLDAIDAGREDARTTLVADLDTTYAQIRARAPGAKVYVLGYPRLFEEPASCSGGPSLTKRKALNVAADELSALIGGRAAAVGFIYVDVRAVFAGHGVCGSSPWINAFGLSVNSYHPNAAGYRYGYLPALTAVTG